ncbi:MAG: GNAT family N-acetyltransferase [Bacteroidetes bacterium]|nr:GNAT family N-acetyltransferase [Bacteroidota bacterium]
MTNFRFSTDLPEKQLFYDLFLTTGWNIQYKLEPDELYEALNQSWYCISAYHDNILVGFGRMICDGVVHALILDLIVHPDYQSKGIGKTILNKLVDKCRQHRIRDIQLFSVKGKAGFYQKCGFKDRPEGAPGMEIKKIR